MKESRKGPRLPAGIYVDGNHYRAIAIIGSGLEGRRKEKAFYQGDRETLEEMIQRAQIWQDETRADLRKQQPGNLRGSLRSAVATYLDTVPAGQHRDRLEYELNPWLDALVDPKHPRRGTWGDMRRLELTRVDVLTQRTRWQDEGLAASTINKYIRALRTLFRTLDGDDAPNPAAFIKKLQEPRATARAIDPELLDQILASMPDVGGVEPRRTRGEHWTRPTVNKSKLRLQVVAAVGMPQKQVMLLTPADLDLDGRRRDVHPPGPHVYSHAREKGDGTPGAWLPLTPKGVAALRAFHAGNCYGRFSTSAVAKAFHRAVERIVARLPEAARDTFRLQAFPPGVRPYDCRHSFATAVLKANPGNPKAVGYLLQHAEGSNITDRYTVGAHADVMSAAIAQLAAAQTPPPPAAKKPRARRGLRVIARGRAG